jgi:hypothetical protein
MILNPKDFVIENQEDARKLNAIADPMNKCPQQNRAGSEDLSRRSFLGQLHSLQRLNQLVERQGQFDIIVLARSDVIFYTAMDAHQILGMEPNTIFVPPFENRDGVNSQFAFGSAKAMKQYLTRITEVGE